MDNSHRDYVLNILKKVYEMSEYSLDKKKIKTERKNVKKLIKRIEVDDEYEF